MDFVHPAQPVQDLGQLITAINLNDNSDSQMGLLLYQAIMAASVGFVNPQVLRDFRYSSRREAQETFYFKATVREPQINSRLSAH